MIDLRDFFDAVLYINLDHRKDRLNHVKEQINKMGLEDRAYRIEAENHKNYPLITNEYAKRHNACTNSHFKSLQFAKDMGFNQVLILEDDFEIIDTEGQNGLDIIKKSIIQLQDVKWDIFYLSAKILNQENNIRIKPNLIKAYHGVLTLHAYVVNNESINRILKLDEGDNEKVLDSIIGNDVTFKKYIASPLTSCQMESMSDIALTRNMTESTKMPIEGKDEWLTKFTIKYSGTNKSNAVLLNDIDCAFYINIKDRVDKDQAIINHFTELDIDQDKILRIDAITPETLGYKKTEDGKFSNEEYSHAAAMSHVIAINKAKKQGAKNVLIMEDDARFFSLDNSSLITTKNALKQLNEYDPSWEILCIGTGISNGNRYPIDKLLSISPNVVLLDNFTGSHCYILNNTCFEDIINPYLRKNEHKPIDLFLSEVLERKYAVYPCSAIQSNDNLNDIGPNNYHGVPVEHWLKEYNCREVISVEDYEKHSN